MFFGSYTEFLYIIVFTIVFNLVKFVLPNALIIRRSLLLIGSFVILSIIIDVNTLLVLLFLMLGSYAMGKIMLSSGINKSSRKKILTASVTFLLFLFCVRNYTWFSALLARNGFENTVNSISFVGRVGLSYILFRLLHFLVDCYRGKIYKQLNSLTFLNYIFFFPTFLSGPIDRYNNFSYWEVQQRKSLSINLWLQGLSRVFIGAAKKLIIVPIILPYVNDLSQFDSITSIWQNQILLSVLAYTFYIYFDFSGYSDIAIGSAYLIGIKTPENFNNPYFSSDIAEFWKKWHISFSSILTEYIFKPFVVGLSSRFPNSPRIRISSIGYLYTFIICGLWHGSTLNFVYWGLWHGIGLVIYKTWDLYKPKDFIKNRFALSISRFSSVMLTFLFAASGWYFFMTNTAEIHSVVKNEITFLNRDYSSGDDVNLEMRSEYWKGYGHGIDLRFDFKEKSDLVIEYRLIGAQEWTKVANPIDSERGYFQIHGDVVVKEDKKNLASGLYIVRIKSVEDDYWYGGIVQIKKYLDE